MTFGEQDLLRQIYALRFLFGDKWTPAIMVALAKGKMRRADILSTINSSAVSAEWADGYTTLHDSILTRTLKKMTDEGLLDRFEVPESFPPQVYYALTPPVFEFLGAIEPAVKWARSNAELVSRAHAYRVHHGPFPHPDGTVGEADTDNPHDGVEP